MKKLFYVEQSVWGKDKKEELYFETEQEANAYYNENDYCSKPEIKTFTEEQAKDLINESKMTLAYFQHSL